VSVQSPETSGKGTNHLIFLVIIKNKRTKLYQGFEKEKEI
jgi:hypothetical protein